MSKFQEERLELKKTIPSMSSRQQILYLMKETSNNFPNEEKDGILLDYNEYFIKQKERHLGSLSKEVQKERSKFIKQSMKEYTPIKKNIYIDRKKYAFTEDEGYVCSCEKPLINSSEVDLTKSEDELFGCGKNCINKMVSWECVEHLCPSGIACRNRRFQLHQYADVYPIKTQDRGYGLFAGQNLPKGTFVMQYIGEIYSIDSEYGIRKLNEYKSKTCTYLMSLSKNEVIDPTYKGNLARFINHSCEPNCETQKWHVLGEVCVGIFTLRDIAEGEELTFNYGFNILKTTFQKCLCGTASCRGYLGIVSNNDINSYKNLNQIVCFACKNTCRSSDVLLVCDVCRKIYHRDCGKKKNDTNSKDICILCTKKGSNNSIAVVNEPKIIENIAADMKPVDSIQENTSTSLQVTKELSNLSFKNKKPQTMKEKVKKKNKSVSSIEANENENSETEKINFSVNNDKHTIEPQEEMQVTQVEKIPEVDPIIDESFEVEENDLKKITKNLRSLSTIGARLFWDYRHVNETPSNTLSSPIEIKITGTAKQIENVKQEINKIMLEKDTSSEIFTVSINVPKIFVRKIIGHQNRNLNSYKNRYNVEITYDYNLITDDIFPIQESTTISIKGTENSVKAVEKEVKASLYNLKVLTIFLMPFDYVYIKSSICQLKTMIDPADLRLRKKDSKNEREIKHSFYYVPNSNKELVVIGFESEIKKGEKVIKEFILRQNTLELNYSLCFLAPMMFNSQLNNFIRENVNMLRNRNVLMRIYDPVYSRKHLNVYIEGKWKDIIEVKANLFKYLTKDKNIIQDFQQYAYNQEQKLISKNVRKFLLDRSYNVPNWDVLSEEVYQEAFTDLISQGQANITFRKDRKEEENQFLKNFLQYDDRDARLNYLLHLPAGSYENVLHVNKLDLVKDLIYHVEEAYSSYVQRSKPLEQRIATTPQISSNVTSTPLQEISSNTKKTEESPTFSDEEKNRNPIVDSDSDQRSDSESLKTIRSKDMPKILPSNFSTTFDNIQNTLLNKLNELRKESKMSNFINTEYKSSIMSNNQIQISQEETKPSNFNLQLNPNRRSNSNELDDKNGSSGGSLKSCQQNGNISYNFSNISQMNININISNLKEFINERSINTKEDNPLDNDKYRREDKNFLKRKTKRDHSLSPYDNENVSYYRDKYKTYNNRDNEDKHSNYRGNFSSNYTRYHIRKDSRSLSRSRSNENIYTRGDDRDKLPTRKNYTKSSKFGRRSPTEKSFNSSKSNGSLSSLSNYRESKDHTTTYKKPMSFTRSNFERDNNDLNTGAEKYRSEDNDLDRRNRSNFYNYDERNQRSSINNYKGHTTYYPLNRDRRPMTNFHYRNNYNHNPNYQRPNYVPNRYNNRNQRERASSSSRSGSNSRRRVNKYNEYLNTRLERVEKNDSECESSNINELKNNLQKPPI